MRVFSGTVAASLLLALATGIRPSAAAPAPAAAAEDAPSWSLIIARTPPAAQTTGFKPYLHPAKLTQLLSDSLLAAASTTPASCQAPAKVLYAGQYAVSPPVLMSKNEPASEVALWWSAHESTSSSCAITLQESSPSTQIPLQIDSILPSITSPHKHLVFVAQEALDPSLLDERSNASWASPMLLQHVAAQTLDVIDAQGSRREVERWTWEQQMRALLGGSSFKRESTDLDTPSVALHSSANDNTQAIFAADKTGEKVARVTDIHTLHEHVQLLHLNKYWALLQMDDAALLSHELFLPTDSRISLIPSSEQASLSATADGPAGNSSEPSYPQPVFSSLISSILASNQISTKRLQKDARVLTAEDANPGWVTRHSATAGGRQAAEWVLSQMQASLEWVAGAECHLHEYDPIFAPNVVCTIKSDPEAVAAEKKRLVAVKGEEEAEGLVLVSAHYDSRGTFGYIEAPGGDDDGSGTTLVLGLARVIGEYRLRFARDVHIVAHSGEEQGLIGSKHYARLLREKKEAVRLALQADMVAFHQPGEPPQLAFPNRLATDSATKYVQSLAQLYTPELVTGYCTACCSDHQSYWEEGFPATWLFERNGAIADPAYHQSYDLTNRTGYDFDQLRGATQVALATILETAHFYL
ncbi:unnamed protein product [Tilletia controversa]|nr:unnamed protein product [Tilletia controversa]